MATFTLSIVGFFTEIASVPVTITDLPPGGAITPKQVLDQYKADQAAHGVVFDYATITNPFLLKPDGTVRNLLYSFTYKGFTLASILSNIQFTEERVWQFYIVTKDGMVVVNDKPRQTFDEFKLTDGDSVIWRLVTVLKSPTPKRVKKAEAKAENNLPKNY